MVKGATQRTPDLENIVQEIVSRAGWYSGNALAILIEGSGHRTARAFDSDSAGAALLHVEYVDDAEANQPPAVNAGPDRVVTLPATADLGGTVTDDGLPEPSQVRTTWMMLDGPAPVRFADATAAATQASFDSMGTYRFELAASDGARSGGDTVVVVVEPPIPSDWPPAVAAPATAHGVAAAMIAIPVTAADPDSDAIDSLTVDLSALPVANDATFVVDEAHRTGTLFWTPAASDARAQPYRVTFRAHNTLGGAAITEVRVASTVCERRIAASKDDAEELETGAMTRWNGDLDLMLDNTLQRAVGMRFVDLAIPEGAIITHADVELTVDETQS
jgi:hypothetical protein